MLFDRLVARFYHRLSTGDIPEVCRSMNLAKDEAIKLIQSLPDDCTLEDIQYHLYVRQKVERGLAAIEAGQVVPQEEAERRVADWARSSGQSRP